jgi:hypothetical protein
MKVELNYNDETCILEPGDVVEIGGELVIAEHVGTGRVIVRKLTFRERL